MFTDKLKGFINQHMKEGNNKKNIESLIFFIILLVITIIIINNIWQGDKTTHKQENTINSKQLAVKDSKNNDDQNSDSNDLELKLENILAKIQGVGEVKVMLNFSESKQVVAMFNENSKVSNTEETDTSGGVRKIQETDTQKDVIYQEENGEKTPMTEKIIEPKIEGAIITAKGASDINVKTNIVQAVEAVTGLSTHKIQVFEMQ